MKLTTEYKNLKFGAPPDGVIIKVWLWVKNGNGLNWVIYSEYKL
jgi:hypothetical protein